MDDFFDRKPTILCVDDTPTNLSLLGELLKGFCRVKSATTGENALRIVASNPPDLILLDVMMPGLDGYDVCRRLKMDPRSRDIPILFLTAKTQVEDETHGFDVGAADYIHKPISPPILLARVRHHLKMKHYHELLFNRNQSLEVEVAHRIGQIQRMQDATIHVITTLAEFRDEETGNHIRRTQEYMRLIVNEMCRYVEHAAFLDGERREQIVISAPLHDVGKVAIPDTILLKAGPLTAEEFEVMKSHAVRGDEILSQAMKNLGDTGGFLEIARQIARSHHEKWNGTGYPDQLVATSIPLPARMMAVADVYDAVRSERPYKRAMSHDEALEILLAGRGSHFDPQIIDIFVGFGERVQEIMKRWGDS